VSDALPGLDVEALAKHLDAAGVLAGPLTASLITGGRSNLTYKVADGVHDWVLRRPPLGHVLATAHDMGREFRVISALAPTEVPVPKTELYCEDSSVIGAPFYLMERVDGTPMRSRADTAGLSPQQAAEIADELIDVLAELHEVDPQQVGLGDFGRPDGFMTRQVARWRKQLDASRSRDLPGIDELHAKLAATVPAAQRATIVHGDYRLDNALVTTEPLAISAVLDWEMSTLGDPLSDLGLFVVYWAGVGQAETDPITNGVNATPGFPDIDALVERYARRTGLDVSGLGWYVAFAYFKLAVILEGIHYRFVQGGTVGAGFERIGALVGPLVEHGAAAVAAVKED
jgi:aminoglycoside phosphotransferase (APT) family kinase protein